MSSKWQVALQIDKRQKKKVSLGGCTRYTNCRICDNQTCPYWLLRTIYQSIRSEALTRKSNFNLAVMITHYSYFTVKVSYGDDYG
jgi:hypothetical protein